MVCSCETRQRRSAISFRNDAGAGRSAALRRSLPEGRVASEGVRGYMSTWAKNATVVCLPVSLHLSLPLPRGRCPAPLASHASSPPAPSLPGHRRTSHPRRSLAPPPPSPPPPFSTLRSPLGRAPPAFLARPRDNECGVRGTRARAILCVRSAAPPSSLRPPAGMRAGSEEASFPNQSGIGEKI